MTLHPIPVPPRVPEPDPKTAHTCLLRAWKLFQWGDPVDRLEDAEHLLALCRQRYQDAQDEIVKMINERRSKKAVD